MAVSSFKCQWYSVDVTSNTAMRADDIHCICLLRALTAMHSVVPLTWFKFTNNSGSTWDYRFLAVDGRRWNQTIDFGSQSDPAVTYAVGSSWKTSEANLQKAIRDVVIALAGRGVTSIVATFP